ncbi:MAG: L-ribulose-5-phosphate 3-epimerase [Culicoidibacterales bacterium]
MRTMVGIYEKALPKNISWPERFRIAKQLGFDFIELSIDETDQRLARLDWSLSQRAEIKSESISQAIAIRSLCLSAHRRFPFGSNDANIREIAWEIMEKAIKLADDLGVRVIQLAGYDVYYEDKSEATKERFISGLKRACKLAATYQVTLAIEIMDDVFMSSITKYMMIKNAVDSQWLKVYPDLGNISAWPGNDILAEFTLGRNEIVAIHLKDTLAVSEQFPGKFKGVAFGLGCVDFNYCLQVLKSLDYQGPFLIEMWSEDEADYVGEITKAKNFLLPKLAEEGF